ncbi:MAG: glycosyltransferase [Bacteroidetes bacterium]|nr:glycosyltransferase [Bacteroidota bacterium]
MESLHAYADIVGHEVIDQLRQLAAPLKNRKVVHVNSTRMGGGVAEILNKLIPLMNELGIETHWEVISGNTDFYQCTKSFHNGLQGNTVNIPSNLLRNFEETNRENATLLRPALQDADLVFIHDPQPAPLLEHISDRKGKWIWRCHIDVSHPYRPVWKYLRPFLAGYDASIWSLPDFAQTLPHPQYIIPPSIDPLSDKNIALPEEEISGIYAEFDIDPDRPLVTQISRYDRFKDPVGVVAAYQLSKRFIPGLQLVLAGGGASDDPEGEAVLDEVYAAANGDPDIKILLLPADAHRKINALQRVSDIVLQKSTREGFGLTVTEALWKGRPVIGGNTGGIRLQVINHHTGFLVSTPEGAALRIRYLLNHRDILEHMGKTAQEFVRDHFLLTRHLREYLTLMVILSKNNSDRIMLS